jgi:cell wall-associated NlpC family hydrolase
MKNTIKKTIFGSLATLITLGATAGFASADNVTVKPGQTLSEIAVKNNTTVASLTKDNNLSNPNLIFVGQKLSVDGQKTTKKTTTRNNTQTSTKTVVNTSVTSYAKQFIGTPYVWGGSTPAGFDCSGLVSYAYRNALGIYLPRTAAGQASVTTRIPVTSAQPGDLLFWSNASGRVYHVALSLGNGQYIHAPQPGQTVTIASTGYWAPSFAGRVR